MYVLYLYLVKSNHARVIANTQLYILTEFAKISYLVLKYKLKHLLLNLIQYNCKYINKINVSSKKNIYINIDNITCLQL